MMMTTHRTPSHLPTTPAPALVRTALLTLIGLTLVLTTGCARKKQERDGPGGIKTVETTSPILPTVSDRAVFLRASFDDDPSSFMGRFVSDSLKPEEIDETRGAQSVCSRHITYKDVRASGSFEQFHQASSDVMAKLGIAPIPIPEAAGVAVGGKVGVDNKRMASIMVRYKMTRKLTAEIKDVEAFETCCRSNPGACSSRYIGEFWAGSGAIFGLAGRATETDASVSVPTKGDVGVAVVNGWQWRRSTEFEDVFFALRVYDANAGDSCAWADVLPTNTEGTYFVGISPAAATEDFARDLAMRHARQQVIRYLGEYITSSDRSRGSMMQGYFEDDRLVETASSGLASLVKDDRYCKVELVDTPEGPMYRTKVLAFFPNAQRDQAVRQTVNTVKEELRRQDKLSPQELKELEALASAFEEE